MEVFVTQSQTDLPVKDSSIKSLIKGFLKHADVHFDEVSIHLVDKEKISSIHAEFFNDPSPTDCISFPMDDPHEDGYKMMGDVFVCPAVAIEYAEKHAKDPYQETTLYVIHGLLHLLGYDDIDPDERKEMRAAEQHYLKFIEQKKLWLK